tara:strand:- start:555 stop:1067 length:513 start_codon:yes stop_codon:yes gene_type:complete
MNLEQLVSSYPDFPKKGILFRDMSPILRSPTAMTSMLNRLGDFSDRLTPDYIVGIESRGFIIGTALATRQRMGFIPIRKKGKLPGKVIGVDYTLEYGKDRLEIQSDILKDQKVLLVDDLLATGGTVNAASKLISRVGGRLVGCAFVIELLGLNGRDNVPDVPITSLISYD